MAVDSSAWMQMSPDQQAQVALSLQQQQADQEARARIMLAQNEQSQAVHPMAGDNTDVATAQAAKDAFHFHLPQFLTPSPTPTPTATPTSTPTEDTSTWGAMAKQVPKSALMRDTKGFKYGSKK